MALSVREQILAAFRGVLDDVDAPNVPGSFTVYRGRRTEVPEGSLPALNMVVQSAGGAEQINSGVEEHRLRVSVEAVLKADDDESLDSQLAALAPAIHRAVMADFTFGGLAVDTNLVADDQAAASVEGMGSLGTVLTTYELTYWTKPGDPYALAP